jgi:predicted HTH domain antitoxin
MDFVDRLINQAVVRYFDQRPIIDDKEGLADQHVAQLADRQARFDLVLAYYLAGVISLGRVAELLELPWPDLRIRFRRLNVPLHTAPTDLHEARLDVEIAQAWATSPSQ